MEQIEVNNIFLDEEGHKEYIEKTKQLKEDFDTISALISKIVLEGRKEDANTDYERLMITRKHLKETIQSRENEMSKIIIVSRKEDSDYLDIGDVVRVSLKFPNGVTEEDTFELTAGENDLTGEVSKISINVPLGKCVYKKDVGDIDSYDIRDGKVQVTILEKIKVKSLKKVSEDL